MLRRDNHHFTFTQEISNQGISTSEDAAIFTLAQQLFRLCNPLGVQSSLRGVMVIFCSLMIRRASYQTLTNSCFTTPVIVILALETNSQSKAKLYYCGSYNFRGMMALK